MRAKVADFGLVRLAPEVKGSIETRIAGTFGYLAPEYAGTLLFFIMFWLILFIYIFTFSESDRLYLQFAEKFFRKLHERCHIYIYKFGIAFIEIYSY